MLLTPCALQSVSCRATFRLLLPIVGALLLSSMALAAGDNALDAFAGKTLTYIVPSKPGGGYDRYARLLAKYLPKHLPVAKVIVRNSPGAGGLLAAHQLYYAQADGLSIGTINSGVVWAQVLDNPNLRFDANQFSWIGKSASDYRVLVMGENSGYQNLQDIRSSEQPVIFGTGGAGGASYNESRLLLGMLQINAKLIPGFGGDNSVLALRRGDIDGRLFSYSTVRDFVRSGAGKIVLQVGGSGVLGTNIPRLRDFPLVGQSDIALDILDAITDLGRLSAAPPGVPQERLQLLRKAYFDTLSDPQFLAEAAKLHLSVVPGRGDLVEERLAGILSKAQQHQQVLQGLLQWYR